MKILNVKVLRGPNYWSNYRKHLIEMKLDLEETESTPTDTIDGFAERLEALMPSLYAHRCSEGRPGGFLYRVRKGTWMGHVIEHIALELQALAGMNCGYGRTRSAGAPGVYHVVFSYEIPEAGIYAAKAAVRISEALMAGTAYDLSMDIDQLVKIHAHCGLGPSTRSIVNAADRRGIPWRRLNDSSWILLGQGVNQRMIEAGVASTTSNIAVELASDKQATTELLREAYIPVPDERCIVSAGQLAEVADELGFPLAVKPVDGNHGRGVTTNIRSVEQLEEAFTRASAISGRVLVQRSLPGTDFRFLVINYKTEAVARRTPAYVVGDGVSTIEELVERTNLEPERGDGHENTLTKIRLDDHTDKLLAAKGLTRSSVIKTGEILFLKQTANLSTGGTATDVTDIVHPDNLFLAERIARLMNLDICGIDVVADDITRPIGGDNGAVIEVNAGPGFRMHLFPSRGMGRDVGTPVINMLYPAGTSSRIPIVAVTGTNGKTTTTRLVAHMARTAGHSVGYTTTDGIYIRDHRVREGDCSGPSSAEAVLRDPCVDFAVLECARGGILRAGLGFDKCNISIITNITEDHLGVDGIDTLEQLARVKSVVAHSTFDNGYAILNAEDELVYALKDELSCRIALFSMNDNDRVRSHCQAGGMAAIIEKGWLTICKGEWRSRIARVNEIPLTYEGRAQCMIKNLLPAVLAAALSDIGIQEIRKGLQSFLPGTENTPGRMNLFKFRGFDLLLDYAHNTDGFLMLKSFVSSVPADWKLGIIGCPGDRRDEDIIRMGELAGQTFDEIIIRYEKDSRDRSNEEIRDLVLRGIRRANADVHVHTCTTEIEGINFAISHARPGSFITLTSDDITPALEYLNTQLKMDRSQIAEAV
jgi:cyanophycin synthetase